MYGMVFYTYTYTTKMNAVHFISLLFFFYKQILSQKSGIEHQNTERTTHTVDLYSHQSFVLLLVCWLPFFFRYRTHII